MRLSGRIIERGRARGIAISFELADSLAAYFQLLAQWNRRINLTALDVANESDAAIDRLVIEPMEAAGSIRSSDQLLVDVGSGNGSPAIPMKLGNPGLQFELIESRGRKAAFLNEAVRQLKLTGLQVENMRLAEFVQAGRLSGEVDVVTVRAVSVDKKLLASIAALLRPTGRLFWFGGGPDTLAWLESQKWAGQVVPGSDLVIVRRLRA